MNFANVCADELRQGWQCRTLAASDGKFRAALMSAMFQEYAEHMKILLRVAFPGFTDIDLPALSGYAAVTRQGRVICRCINRDRSHSVVVVYDSDKELISDMRKLADRLKLNDMDRAAYADCVKRWIARDERIDHMGRRLAS